MSDKPKVTHQARDHKGEFVIKHEESVIAKMTYTRVGNTRIIIDHTEVNEAHKEKGLGRAIVEAGVEWARQNEVKVIPLCPFAKSIINKTPELQDVL